MVDIQTMGYETREILIDSISELNSDYIKNISRGANSLTLSFDLNIYDQEVFEKINRLIIELKNSGIQVKVNVKTEKHDFSVKNMLQFRKLQKDLADDSIKLSFDGGISKEYDTKEVYLAQSKLKALTSRINNSDMSPFEKYLYIYDFLIKKMYKENYEDSSKSRDIIALMNGDYIVCTGYAKLMQKICKDVGIECMTQACAVTSKNGESYNHENNLVRIDDDKYNIHGWYYCDACWDHVEEKNPNKKTFSFCLLPLSDKDKMNVDIKINDDTLFFYDDKENYYKLIDGDYYGSNFGIDYSTGEYSKIIKYYGLEQKYRIEEARVKDTLSNDYLKQYSVNKLEEIFKKHKIPADVYDKKSEIPYGCSMEFLLSMCILGKDDSIIESKVKELKKYYNSDETLEFYNSARCYSSDIYAEFNNMVQNANDPDDFRWQFVEQKTVKALMADTVKEKLKSEGAKAGAPISAENFKKALTKVQLETDRIQFQPAASKARKIVQDTVNLSATVFVDDALNGFKQESTMKNQKI